MLLEIYIFITITAFVTLILAAITKNSTGLQGNIPLYIVAAILFFSSAYFSQDIEYERCQNQVGWMNTTNNNTALTNNFACYSSVHNDSGLAWINIGMGVLSILLLIITSLLDFKNVERRL